ncbi:hypothetical protein Tsubulata_040296 [Turnera subulata]|uniref:Transmembrane protein n=1 Tax=Turnera subulata TaxID=218843 RepID=A0A9Q0GN80_9ROSI|nr:hypothetical protein Tsubulata_040296 [Turnera subulata]
MEALWNLEEKWKLTTKEAVVFLVCTSLAVIGLCTGTMLKRKSRREKSSRIVVLSQETAGTTAETNKDSSNWDIITIRRVLMGSTRWSGADKWAEERSVVWPSSPLIGLLEKSDHHEYSSGHVERHSHNSASPVWQRPILKGERCELPRYSGVILYDERGQLLDQPCTSSSSSSSVMYDIEQGCR